MFYPEGKGAEGGNAYDLHLQPESHEEISHPTGERESFPDRQFSEAHTRRTNSTPHIPLPPVLMPTT